jgi:indole-3-glycerol phosphate synthase
MQAGASALSVLTDNSFFGGKYEDLTTARNFNFCPILRKDFIIDEYQIVEAKSMGADVILLIAGILDAGQVQSLGAFARSLGLEILLEVHDREELERTLCEQVDLIGVNNRNLKDFTVSVDTSKELAALIPASFIKVSESGISKPETIQDLRNYGYKGFLMGEAFMKTSRPEKACAAFIQELKQLAAV